jgi:hypothetical protein
MFLLKALWYVWFALDWTQKHLRLRLYAIGEWFPSFDDWMEETEITRRYREKGRLAERLRLDLAQLGWSDNERDHIESRLRGAEQEMGWLDHNLEQLGRRRR